MPTINGVYYAPNDPHVPASMGGTNPNATEVAQAGGSSYGMVQTPPSGGGGGSQYVPPVSSGGGSPSGGGGTMNSQNFVAADPANPGKYVVYVNGVQQVDANGNASWDPQFAAQVYNNALGGGRSGGSSSPLASGLTSTLTPGTPGMDPNQYYTLADGSVKNRAMLIQGLVDAKSNYAWPQLNSMSNQDLVNASNGAYSQGQQGLQQQQYKNQTLSNFGQSLLSQIGTQNNPGLFAPAMEMELNGVLGQLGLPALPSPSAQAAQGIIPNAVTPAEWDALPDAMKQLILTAWTARGGSQNDFLAGINAQRPNYTGNPNAMSVVGPAFASPAVHYAPLGA